MKKCFAAWLLVVLALSFGMTAQATGPENAPAMLYHGGYAAQADEWIYFSIGGSLYKMREDGSDSTALLEASAKNIIVVDDYIYYCAGMEQEASRIWRVRTDGSGREAVLEEGVMFFAAAGEWLYFQPFGDGGLHRVALSGGEAEPVLQERCERFSILGDVLHASFKGDAGYTLKSYQLPDMSPIASFPTLDVLLYAGTDGWLYTKTGYYDVQLAISPDGAESRDVRGLFGDTFDGQRYFRIGNAGSFWKGNLFLGTAGPVYCMDIETGKEKKVLSGYHTKVYAAVGDWVFSMEYFPDSEAYEPSVYNMRTKKGLEL